MPALASSLLRVAGDPRLLRLAGAVGWLAVAGFWALVLVGAGRQPGYDPTRDYVSSLAAVGAQDPWIGLVALVLLAVAYLAAAHVLLWRLQLLAAALLTAAAGLVTLLVAAARLDCPRGSARCGLSADVGRYVERLDDASWGQVVHGPAVAVSSVLLLAAMIVVAVRCRPSRTSLVSGVAAIASAVTPLSWVPSSEPGLGQRVWLATLCGWILWVCALALTTRGAQGRRPDEPDPGAALR